MPDMELDMCSLIAAGLPPVLSAQYAEHLGYSGLTTAMLSRLGKDCTLIPLCVELSVPICSLFCELQLAILCSALPLDGMSVTSLAAGCMYCQGSS